MSNRSEGLTGSQEQAWSLLVGVTTWLPTTMDANLAQVAGLSHAEYQVLRWLARAEGGALHMTRLANTTSVTQSHLSRIVARLEKRELVSREPDPDDGRYTLARLTDAGAAVVSGADGTYGASVRELVFDGLPDDDIDALARVSARILQRIRPECLDAHAAQAEPAGS